MTARSVTFRSEYRSGGKVSSTKKKYVPDVAKTAQHPQSQLKTQKELKKITDSKEYKKGDYKKQTEMLGGKVYARGGVAGKGARTTTATKTKKKEPGFIKKTLGKLRKKFIPTFGEQFEAAAGKKTFTSTRKKKEGSGWTGEELGKLHYATTKEPDVKKKIAKSKAAALKAKEGKGGGADSGSKKKPVYEKATGTKVSERGQAFAAARKAGKKEFTFEGKKYHTRLKGEEKKKPLISGKGIFGKKINIPKIELSGGTAKKIKKRIGRQGGGRIADAARRAQIHGFYSPDMGMGGRGPGMPGPNVTGGRDPRIAMRGRGPGPGMARGRGPGPGMAMRGRGYAKGGLIKGKPKLAVKGW
jgi:hypothetical protein